MFGKPEALPSPFQVSLNTSWIHPSWILRNEGVFRERFPSVIPGFALVAQRLQRLPERLAFGDHARLPKQFSTGDNFVVVVIVVTELWSDTPT